MKMSLAAILIYLFAFTGAAALASDMQQESQWSADTQLTESAGDGVTDGLGLLLDTPHTQLDEIYGPSSKPA